jgi:uncharacterized iron-regulated membrane protein
MGSAAQANGWQRWLRQPQRIWLRRALFQAHLWTGLVLGLYVFMISVTGSVLVYRNELFRAATPEPRISTASGPQLTDRQLKAAVARLYPDYVIVNLGRPLNPDQAVDVRLRRGTEIRHRLIDPKTGSDLGDSVSMGIRMVSGLLDLHDNLFAGPAGRKVNGAGALALLVLAVSGMVVWWPGVKTWRRSVTVPRGVGWKRLNWHLHSMIGFWSLAFVLAFGLSGIYLTFPDRIQDFADWLEPLTAANMRTRVGDRIIYWLAYVHFGRINGIGIPCSGPGFCDQATKATWALFGLAPAAMFVTGGIMWWNRVLRPRWKALAKRGSAASAAVVSSGRENTIEANHAR